MARLLESLVTPDLLEHPGYGGYGGYGGYCGYLHFQEEKLLVRIGYWVRLTF